MTGFWSGFLKKASTTGGLTGGSGHTGEGKGALLGQLEKDRTDGTEGAVGRADGEGTRTDKTLRDAERGPRSFDPFSNGPEFYDEATKVRY